MRFLSGILAAWAFAYVAMLPVFFVWMTWDDNRSWTISGPPPFDDWGSGPYALWYLVTLLLAGALLALASRLAYTGRARAATVVGAVGAVLPPLYLVG